MTNRRYWKKLAEDEAQLCINQNIVIAGAMQAIIHILEQMKGPELYLADGYDYADVLATLRDMTPKVTPRAITDVHEVFADKFNVDQGEDQP